MFFILIILPVSSNNSSLAAAMAGKKLEEFLKNVQKISFDTVFGSHAGNWNTLNISSECRSAISYTQEKMEKYDATWALKSKN